MRHKGLRVVVLFEGRDAAGKGVRSRGLRKSHPVSAVSSRLGQQRNKKRHSGISNLGHKGIYALGGFMGLADVDPFIHGVSQSAGHDVPVIVGAAGIVVAGASNNVAKGFYAYGFSNRQTCRQSLVLLSSLALAGLRPLIYLLR
jgi:hypothetical protein